MAGSTGRTLALALAFACASRLAVADDSPWAVGVPPDAQAKANELFAEGNQLFGEQAHAPAYDKYRAAIALWDHPLIRFNMAVTLIRLDRLLDAADHLERALRFGDKPFSPEHYHEALDYQKLLRGRIGEIEASCDQAETHVVLDGKRWFDCPGKKKLRVLAGDHQLAGERDGYLPSHHQVIVVGGVVAAASVTLVPLESAVKLVYPIRRWIPWAIAGGGAAIALGGLGVWIVGRRQLDRFYTDYAAACPTGCKAGAPSLDHERHSAELKGEIGVSLIVVGGIAALGGVVFAVLDRPNRILPKMELTPETGGMSATIGWSFR